MMSFVESLNNLEFRCKMFQNIGRFPYELNCGFVFLLN
jgi:hypothetical protein